MKTSARLLSLVALAGGSAAIAAPRESFTLTNVPSIARQGTAGNFSTTLLATGADAGGSYVARSVSISGAIGNFRGISWQREAMILVTPPSGTPFIAAPFTVDDSIAATVTGRLAVPVDAVSTAGTWTFEFFDDFDDASTAPASAGSLGAFDAIWSTVTVALDDALPVVPGLSSGPGVSFTDVASDGLAAAPSQTRTWTNSTPITPLLPGIRVRGLLTATTPSPTNLAVNLTGDARVSVLLPGAATPTALIGTAGAFTSSQVIDTVVALPVGTPLTGDFTFNFFEAANLAGGIDNRWQNISFELIDRSPSAVIIPLADGGAWNTATRAIAGAGDIAWFTFTTPASLTATGGLDIDTTGTTLAPVNDTDIGLYTAAGALVDSDEDDSTDLLSQLSYGAAGTFRNATGNGLRFLGQDGTTAGGTGNMTAGTQYFLAVAGGNAATHATTFNSSGGVNTGSVTARVRVWSSDAPIEPAVAPASVDLGTFAGPGASETVVSSTWTMAAANEVKWFKFTTSQDATNATTNYVDIDTDLTNPGEASATGNVQDTHLGIFRSSGAFIISDDDDGIDQRSAFSFGDNVNIRPANTPTAPNVAGAARNGRDGALIAGTYYVSVATFLPTYAAGFTVTPDATRTAVGSRTLSIRSNFALQPSCVCCNLSNVAGPNQSTVPDNSLTADDIIVFLGWYFANDNRANVAGPNQSTIPDNALTADDIIVFLGRYFAGC